MLYVIDSGHEGKGFDIGAKGKYSLECDINLKFALLLGNKLKLKGHKVIYTRQGSLKQNTYQKADMANKNKADRFISIHCNSYGDPNSNGVETYICKGVKGETLEVGKRIQSALVKSSGLRDRGLKEANYDVLVKTNMPAWLIELGFISNTNEEKLLNDDKWLDNVASGICESLCDEGSDNVDFDVVKKSFKVSDYKADIIETKGLTDKGIIKRDNPTALVNMGLYDMDTHMNFMYMENENKKHSNGYQGSKYGVGVKKDGTVIPCTWDDACKSDDIKDFISASPTIMFGGKKCVDWGTLNSSYLANNAHYRMLVGFKCGEVSLCACNQKMSVEECYQYAAQQGFTDCFAYDGNGSQSLYVDGKQYKVSSRQNVTWLELFKKEIPKPSNKQKVRIDGVIYETDAKIIDGSTYIKLRDFTQAGYKVAYVNGVPTIDKIK